MDFVLQVQNDSETEPGATERMVTLIGNKKATDMAYELIKEVIDEVQLPSVHLKFKLYVPVCACRSWYLWSLLLRSIVQGNFLIVLSLHWCIFAKYYR